MRVLIVGELGGYFGKASQIATKKGAKVRKVDNIEQALLTLRSIYSAELMLIDATLDIKTLHTALLTEHIHIDIVACGTENIEKNIAIKAIQDGAKEYISLPPDENIISAILETITDSSSNMIINSSSMQRVINIANQVAPTDATILVTGQSGTGKEVLSRYIHNQSRRKHKPFISVNCAAIPENLLESEMFGHEKGSFTGAIARRIGKFEESNEGTLLLDEISEIDVRLQAKLLRAIQEQEINRVGGTKPIKLNLRIIATSNRDLKQEVINGNFREDLYFRLNVINLEIPSLAQRQEDITPLCQHFIKKYCIMNKLPIKEINPSALEKLKEYHWPGNVREFENIIYRAVLLSKQVINIENLNLNFDNISRDSSIQLNSLIGQTISSVEKQFVKHTMKHCLGNATQAANILGISLNKLKEKLEKYEREEA